MLYLRQMDEKEYQKFLDYAITNYAEEKIEASNFAPEEAMALSTQEYRELLPDGVHTKDNFLLMAIEKTQDIPVGFAWLTIEQTGNWRYLTLVNILIYEEFQRQGYGTETLHLIAEKGRELGLDKLTLHAFGHNKGAIALYERVGFRITNVHMAKSLK